jgi:hypothetical protein
LTVIQIAKNDERFESGAVAGHARKVGERGDGHVTLAGALNEGRDVCALQADARPRTKPAVFAAKQEEHLVWKVLDDIRAVAGGVDEHIVAADFGTPLSQHFLIQHCRPRRESKVLESDGSRELRGSNLGACRVNIVDLLKRDKGPREEIGGVDDGERA